jgi:hypothetical protein
MNTVTTTSPACEAPVLARHESAVPFGRLLRVQLRALRTQRGVFWTTVAAILLGLLATGVGLNIPGKPSASAIEDGFAGSATAYVLLWLAIGALAGSAPFRSGWAPMILSIAPSRNRWLAASYLSTIGWAVAATAVFVPLAVGVAVTYLAVRGHDVSASVGVLSALPPVIGDLMLKVTVGFALGAVFRGVTIPIMLGYVATSFVALLESATKGLSRWVDLQYATSVITGTQEATHGIAPAMVALACWMAVPALLAAVRLHRSDLR